MNKIIQLAEDCVGYACGPTTSTPAGEVEVHRIAQDLAATGVDPMGVVWWLCAAVILMASGGAALIKHREKRQRH